MARLSRRQLIALSGLATGAAVLPVASGFRKDVALARSAQSRTLRIALNGEPAMITGIASTSAQQLTAKATEGLVAFGLDMKPRPALATAWSVSNDGLHYRFALRPGVFFHDGTPFTSADAAYSIRAAKEVHPRGRLTFANIAALETPDPLTLVIKLSKPALYLLPALNATETPIVPRHLYEGTDIAANPHNVRPIGTGPFVFKEWKRGSHILFERNPHYWDPPKPYFDKLIFLFHSDADMRAAALESGEVDIAPSSPVSPGNLARLAAMPHLAVENRYGFQYENNVFYLEFNLQRPELRGVRVRRAFAHAIDKSVLRDVVNLGLGEIVAGPLSARMTAFAAPGLPAYDFDIGKAEALLDEAGLRRDAEGIRLRLHIDYIPGGPAYKNAVTYIKQALSRIGIQCSIRSQDFPAYIKRVYTDRDFDLNYYAAGNQFDPSVGVQRLYLSRAFVPGIPFSNGSAYSNPEVDAILDAAAVEVDGTRRRDLFRQFQHIIAADLPNIGLMSNLEFTIYNKSIAGHLASADGVSGSLAGAYRLS